MNGMGSASTEMEDSDDQKRHQQPAPEGGGKVCNVCASAGIRIQRLIIVEMSRNTHRRNGRCGDIRSCGVPSGPVQFVEGVRVGVRCTIIAHRRSNDASPAM